MSTEELLEALKKFTAEGYAEIEGHIITKGKEIVMPIDDLFKTMEKFESEGYAEFDNNLVNYPPLKLLSQF